MPTDSLAVKDVPLEDDKLISQLALIDLGKSHWFGGWPRSNNSELAGLKWYASGNAMASGTKTGEGRGRFTTIKLNRHNRITFTCRLPKTKEN